MSRLLTKPQIDVNGTVIFIVPNSCTVTYGFGTKDVKAQSGGGDVVRVVTSHNIEERIGCLVIEVFSESDNVNRALDLLESNETDDLETSFSDQGAGISGIIKNASIINDPDFKYQADGKFELQFKGEIVKRG